MALSRPASAKSAGDQPDPDIVLRLTRPGDFGGAVTVARFILARLKEHGLVYEAVIAPSHIGLHPCNRGKYGANEASVHELLADIFEVGWDPDEITTPIAVEECPATRYIEAHSARVARNSDLLAPVLPLSIRAGSLTNGHLCLGLRALVAGIPSKNKSMCVDGRLSLEQVRLQQPEMATAAINGWAWQVLHHRCKDLYGDVLFQVLSQTKNISLARRQSETEVLLSIAMLAGEHQKDGRVPPWDDIHQQVCRTKPPCTGFVADLINMVKKYSGGAEGHFVSDFSAFHTRFVSSDRFVGGDFYNYLGNFVFKHKKTNKVEAFPLLRWAVLKAQYAAPAEKVINNECCFVTKADLSKVTNSSPEDVWNADSILGKARELIEGVGGAITPEETVAILGNLDVNIVRVLIKKEQFSSVKYKTLEAASINRLQHRIVRKHRRRSQELHKSIAAGKCTNRELHKSIGARVDSCKHLHNRFRSPTTQLELHYRMPKSTAQSIAKFVCSHQADRSRRC